MGNSLALDDTIIIGDHQFINTHAEDVRINRGDLVGDFVEHPVLFTRWATRYELALDQEARLKDEMERMSAKIDYNTRQEFKDAGMKSTEKMIANTVRTHPKYVELLDEYQDAKLRTGLLKVSRDAMVHRRDMLIQLGATARAEASADISIREATVKNVIKNT